MDRILMNAIEICAIALAIIILCWIIGKCTDRNTGRGSVFSERHPKLNMVISCAIVIIFGMICYVFISYIGYRIKSTIHWMTYVTSKMDAVVIVTFITGAVSIIGVIISSIIAKIIDYRKSRQDYLAMKREIPYGEFVEMIYKVQSNAKDKGSYTEKMMLEDLSKFSKQITLWGSSRVVNKWVEFREKGANPNAGTNNLFLMEEIMNEMRKDLGMKKVKKGNLLAFFVNDIKSCLKK